jgi:transcriptional regulator with XRE-family HTH domain
VDYQSEKIENGLPSPTMRDENSALSRKPQLELDPQLIAIGENLRRIRRQQGLTLRDVESESKGRWKAVVIGSYERGDRALTLKKAIALAHFYRVPLDQLLGIFAPTQSNGVARVFNLKAIREQESAIPQPFLRFLHEICRRRSDWNGELLSIRGSDCETLALILDMSLESLHEWLVNRALVQV